MAEKRGPEFMSSLLRTAVSAIEEVSEQVIKGGVASKKTLDVQLIKRQRRQALADLGEALFAEAERGAALPPVADDLLKEVRRLDEELKAAQRDADAVWKSDADAAKPTGGPRRATDHDDDDDE
jgi:hypothetical protein